MFTLVKKIKQFYSGLCYVSFPPRIITFLECLKTRVLIFKGSFSFAFTINYKYKYSASYLPAFNNQAQ